jgi:phospholipid-translocating ATPase
MEMKKLHMGTMSYGSDSMDEVAHQLEVAFGVSETQSKVFPLQKPTLHFLIFSSAHNRSSSLATGAQLATRGRRDMSSRVRDVVLSLALCHNVCFNFLPTPISSFTHTVPGYTSDKR